MLRMTGCPVSWKCRVAWVRADESQQPTLPQVRHSRRCTQRVPSRTQSSHSPGVFAFTTRGSGRFHEHAFQSGDWFVFGAETRGLPDAVLDQFANEQRVRLPMRPGNRSLNLSNTVAVVVFEAWRQTGFDGGA